MKLEQINKGDIPAIISRKGFEVKENVKLSALETSGVRMVSYGLSVGDIFEFPESESDVQINQRQVSEKGFESLILGLRNNKPAWFSVSNLRRYNHKFEPVHQVAESLFSHDNDTERIKACLGKVITATESVTYDEAIFEDGVRQDGTRAKTIPSLKFVE